MKPVKLYALVDERGKIIRATYSIHKLPYTFTSKEQAVNKRRNLIRHENFSNKIKIIKLEELNE